MGWFKKKNYLCRHPTCHKKFYTKEDMLKHYYPKHEGHPYTPKEEEREIGRYIEGINRAERKIAVGKEGKSYEIAGVDEVHIQSKTKYARPRNKDDISNGVYDKKKLSLLFRLKETIFWGRKKYSSFLTRDVTKNYSNLASWLINFYML